MISRSELQKPRGQKRKKDNVAMPEIYAENSSRELRHHVSVHVLDQDIEMSRLISVKAEAQTLPH